MSSAMLRISVAALRQRLVRSPYACWTMVATQRRWYFPLCALPHKARVPPKFLSFLLRYPATCRSKRAELLAHLMDFDVRWCCVDITRVVSFEAHEDQAVLSWRPSVDARFRRILRGHMQALSFAECVRSAQGLHVGIGLSRESDSSHAQLVNVRADRNRFGSHRHTSREQRNNNDYSDFHGNFSFLCSSNYRLSLPRLEEKVP